MGSEGTDPSSLLAYLTGVSDDVKKLGEATIRGVPTTHYRATVVVARTLEHFDELDPGIGAALREVAADFPESYEVDVWVDADGLLRKMEHEMEVDPLEFGARSLRGHTVVEFFDYGKPVDIAIPPDADIITMEEWLEEVASLLDEWD